MAREDSHSLTDGNGTPPLTQLTHSAHLGAARAFVQLLTEFIALLEAVAETVPSIRTPSTAPLAALRPRPPQCC